ncbi:MAG: carbohydrate ABC transporter permease, partial [Lachnospiraceae bacterium]
MTKRRVTNAIIYVILSLLTVAFLYPLIFILINSFKGKFFISKDPFAIPSGDTFVGLSNYVNGLMKTGLLSAIGYSFFITIVSVALIILFTSMTAYYISRIKSKVTSVIYYMFTFSMIVPFQMVMFTMTSLADKFHLRNPLGMCFLYLGFGAGLSVFMFAGFVKSIPL